MGVAPSASAVSRLNHTLTEQFASWRERGLQNHYRVVYLDGVHFTVRHGTKTDATIILTADGESIWRAAERCSPCGPVQRKAKMAGAASCKTCAPVGSPRSISLSPM